MDEGRLKIGSNFLKIGARYLRIGPAPPPVGFPFYPVKQNSVGSGTTLDMTFDIPEAVDAVVVIAAHVPQCGPVLVGSPAPTITISGDLSWTFIDSIQLAYTYAGDDYRESIFWYWAAVPDTTVGPVAVSVDSDIDVSIGGMFSTLTWIEGVDLVTPINQVDRTSATPSTTTFSGPFVASAKTLGWYFKYRPDAVDDVVDDSYLPGPTEDFSDGVRWGLAFVDALDPSGGSFPLSNMYSFYSLVGGDFVTTVTSPLGIGDQVTEMIEFNSA